MIDMTNNWTRSCSAILDGLEDQKSILSNIEIHIIASLIGDVGSKVSTYESMPISVVFSVQFIF